MLTISKQKLFNRYDSLPQELRDLFFSEASTDLVWLIGDEYHLTEDKKMDLATLVGDIILGFIHPDDLAKYIVPDLGIDARLAQTLAAEIEKKIFASLLTELRQNYKGMAAVAPASALSGDITKTELVYKEPEKPAMVLEEAAKPAELKTYFNQLNGKEPIKEGAKIEVEKREIQAAPAIIHTETEAKPVAKVKSSFGGLMGIFAGGEKVKEEAVAAEVQFSGQQPGAVTQQQVKNEISLQPQSRVVHYTALRTPLTDLQLKTNEPPVAKGGDFVPKIINLESAKSGDKKEIIPLNQWLGEKEKNKVQTIAEFLNQKTPFVKAGIGDLKKESNHPNPLLERGQATLESLGQWLNKKPEISKEDHEKLIAEEFAKLQIETKAKKSSGIFGFFGKAVNNTEQAQDISKKISMNPLLNPLESASLKKVVEKNFTEGDLSPVSESKPQERIAISPIQSELAGIKPIVEMPKAAFETKPSGEFHATAGGPKVVDFTAASMAESVVNAAPAKPLKQIKPGAEIKESKPGNVHVDALLGKPELIQMGQINQVVDHEEHKKIVENHINQSERENIIGNIADIKVNMGKPEILQQAPQPAVSPAVEQIPLPKEEIKSEKQIMPEVQPSMSPKIEARPEAVRQPEPDISKIELKHLPVEEDIIDLRNL